MAAAAKCQMNTTKISVHFLCASTESAQRPGGGDGNVDRNHDDYGESNNRGNSSDLRQIHFRRATTYATKRVFQHIKYENTKAQSKNVPRNVLPVVNQNCRATVVLDVLKRWKLKTGPEGDKACSVWLSGKSLAAHLNLPVTTTAPDSIVSQALFIGQGCCAFFLTLYVRRALAASNENVDDVHDYTIEMVKRQTAALLDYSHSDLVILPCTIAVEDLTPERLQDGIDEEVQKVSHYYSGPLRLSEDVFREIQTAVTAISSETRLSWCLQTASTREPRTEELQSVLVLGGEEQRLLHLAIDHLANGDGNLPLTCRPEASLMTKAVLVEAAKRLGLRQKLSVRTQDDNILQSIRDIQDQSEEEYGVSSQLDASTDVEASVLSIQLISSTHDPDSVSSVLEWCSPPDKDQDKLQDQLADFPHTFQLQNLQQMSTRQMKGLKSGLESALSVGYETGLETARARNLLAFVLWNLDRPDDALEQLDLVLILDEQSNNLVTLANKAVMLRRQHFVSSADDYVQHLRQLQKDCADFRYLVVKAKAELAFTYTRLGPSFIPDADTLFSEVIPEAREPEKWLWKFGLALNRRRKMRARPILFPSSTLGTAEVGEGRSLAQLLQEVTHSNASANLKAKTYAEMAIFLHMVWKKPTKSEIVIEIQMDPKQACERALELDSNDNSVLCKCGRIFRFVGETERSRELLEKALSIRPSSTGYHHLGLTYKCLATREICKQPHRDSGSMQCQGKDAKAMKTAFNSPLKGVVSFSRTDRFMLEALCNLEHAVEFSEGENTLALYDLALTHKSLGELPVAKECLQKIIMNPKHVSVVNLINAFKEMCSVMKEMADCPTESPSVLLMALNLASEILSRSADRNTRGQFKERTKPFQLTTTQKFSIDLLQNVVKIDPQTFHSPDSLKLCIENFTATGQYEKALVLLELFSCTPPCLQATPQGRQYTLKLYVQAARHALLQGSPTSTQHFRAAFQNAMAGNVTEPRSSESTDEPDDDSDCGAWDVMILHEDSELEATVALTEVLAYVCGLNVYVMDRDVPPGSQQSENVLRIMRRSSLLVVLAGNKVSTQLQFFIAAAATRPSTVTLLVDGKHVPETLQAHRSMPLPWELVHACQTADSEATRKRVDAICKVFSFLVNVGDTETARA